MRIISFKAAVFYSYVFVLSVWGATSYSEGWTDFLSRTYRVKVMPCELNLLEWSVRQKRLHGIQKFSIQGQFEVSSPNYQDSFLTFAWKQNLDGYHLILKDAQDITVAELQGNKDQVTLCIANQVYYHKSAEFLLQKHLDLSIPVECLAYWLKGMPAPLHAHERVLSEKEHLLTLRQKGWFMRYLRYHNVRVTDFPVQFCMMKENWYIRVLVTQLKL